MESLGELVPILTTASRAERATLRAAREMARRQAEQNGRVAHIELKDGLAIPQAELERLMTCHRTTYHRIDWRPVASRPGAMLPARTQDRERAARQALANWQPGWQDRMFGDEAERRRQLTQRVLEAQREDELAYQQAYRAAEAYNAETLIARKLVDLDVKAIKDAVALKSRLAELRGGMNGFALAQPGDGRVIALVDAIQEADVPHERIIELDGRPARRELIPLAERRQIHLAALCAAALRVGGELVCVLPLESIEVAIGCEMVDAASGRMASQPVIQLVVTTATLGRLGGKEDAITLATSLGARMDWSIATGFTPIRLIPMSGQPLARSA